MKREIFSGLMLGSVLGVVGFLRIYFYHLIWPSLYGVHWFLLATTIATTLVGVVLWGTLSGSMLPLLLKN